MRRTTCSTVCGLREKRPAGQRERQLVDAVAGVVDAPDALHGQQRAEDLLRQHRRAGGHVGDDRRRAVPARCRELVAAGHDTAGRGGLRGVAAHALGGLALDDRADVGAEGPGRADLQHLDGAGEALEQPVVDRLVGEHAGRRRALLAGVAERGGDDRRDGVVEVGVAVDDAVLPPISATTRLSWRPPGGTSAAARRMSSLTGPEPVKAIVATPGWRTSAAPASPAPGTRAMGVGGDAGLAQRLDDGVPRRPATARRA